MTLNNLEFSKLRVLVFFFFAILLRGTHKEWIATKCPEIDQDSLRTGTAKAVARLMSFAHLTCFNKNAF